MNRLLFTGILFLGLAEFSYGVWIPAKAWFSQQLLASAWEETIQTQQYVKPWSWADTWPVLRLTAKGRSYLVLNGMSGQAMAFGPGMAVRSTLPGQAGNTIISAHRDTHFEFLEDIRPGDEIVLQDRQGRSHVYFVRDLQVVDSRNTGLPLDSTLDRLTLVTCYPFHTTVRDSHLRYVVTAINRETQPT